MVDQLPAGWITDLSHEVLEKLAEMPDGSLRCTEDALGLFRKFIGMVRYEGESYWLYEGLCLSTLEMIDLHYEIGNTQANMAYVLLVTTAAVLDFLLSFAMEFATSSFNKMHEFLTLEEDRIFHVISATRAMHYATPLNQLPLADSRFGAR